jgi:hypothetical protein
LLKKQYENRWKREKDIREGRTLEYPVRKGLVMNCLKVKIHQPI